MKIYVKAQMNPEDAFEMVSDEISNIILEFYNPSRQKNTQMSWSVIPFARVKKIWADFAKHGFVRDVSGLNKIIDKMLKNIVRLEATTILSGHSSIDPDEYFEQLDLPTIDNNPDKNVSDDFYWNFMSTPYGSPITDYGLKPLWDLVSKLINAQSDEQKLVIIDRMLQVTHMNGDLAALFIEGGSSSLSELYSYIPEEYRKFVS